MPPAPTPPAEGGAPLEYPATFSRELAWHCRESHLPPQLFADLRAAAGERPRYVRLHPRLARAWGVSASATATDLDAVAQRLCVALGLGQEAAPRPVLWLPCWCFALPRTCRLHGHPLYDRGELAAMDAASMAAVVALSPRVGDRVLDLCCSPGMKLNLLADACAPDDSPCGLSGGYVVGVDVSVQRLYTARAQVRRHHGGAGDSSTSAPAPPPPPPRVCLVAADGRTFTAEVVATEAMDTHARARVDPLTGLTAVESRRLRQRQKRAAGESNTDASGDRGAAVVYAPTSVREHVLADKGELYDRVLVDAECTHDGSLAHLDLDPDPDGRVTQGLTNVHRMEKMNLGARAGAGESGVHTTRTTAATSSPAAGGDTASPPDAELAALQLKLLLNGYRQLRPGGTLVYSTCSFAFWQNEYIVDRFLRAVRAQSVPQVADDSGAVDPTEAVVVKPFCFVHEADNGRPLADVLTPGPDCDYAALQRRLNEAHGRYGVVAAGSAAIGADAPIFLGSRLWPCDTQTSFQYIAKVWKRPRMTASADVPDRSTLTR